MPIAGIDVTIFNAYWTFTGGGGICAEASAFNPAKPLPSAHNVALFQGLGSMEQDFTAVAAGIYTISYYAQKRPWIAGLQEIQVKIDGAVVHTPSEVNMYRWTRYSFTHDFATPGTHTLRFETLVNADESMFIDSVEIADPSGNPVSLPNGNFDSMRLALNEVIFRPPAIAKPAYRLVASVTTCGKLLECRLVMIDGGADVAYTQINEAPILSINGISLGKIRIEEICSTSAHSTFLIAVPQGGIIIPSDVITLSAPAGWAFGSSSYAEAMDHQVVSNCVGRSFIFPTYPPRTMALGASFSWLVTSDWRPGFATKNQRQRVSGWQPYPKSLDAGGKPLVMAAASSSAVVVNSIINNGIDATNYPTPEGLWGVAWDDLGGTTFGLGTNEAGSITAAGLVDLPIDGGTRRFRVYDFRKAGVSTAFPVVLTLTQAGSAPYTTHFDNLAILAPGDFTWTPGQQTIPPTPAWDELPACVEAKIPTSLPFGPFRYSTSGFLGESAACEREHRCGTGDFRWANDQKDSLTLRYIRARPWTNAESPYIYDPLAGTDYPATLTSSMPESTSGAIEIITISDVDTAPVFAKLILTIGSERLRVMSTLGDVVTVMRGIESTEAVAHDPGAISVSARRPMEDLAAWGPANKQITELVTQSPHGIKSGQILNMQGNWPVFVYSDGRGFITTSPTYGGFISYSVVPYVTGPNSFCVSFGGPDPANPNNTTLGSTYTLDPESASSVLMEPEFGGCPYELAAATAAKHPGAPAWISFCMVASDDMVDEICRGVLANLPADRDVWVELGNEPWNWGGFPYNYWSTMTWMLFRDVSPSTWNAIRSAKIRDRGKAIWAAAGRDPSHVKCYINVRCGDDIAAGMPGFLDFLTGRNAVPDAVAIAPYYSTYPHPAIWKAYGAWSTDMLADLWAWDTCRNTSSYGQSSRVGNFSLHLRLWNSSHDGNVKLNIYEYAPEIPWPIYVGALGAAMDATQETMTLSAGEDPHPLSNYQYDASKVQPGTFLKVDHELLRVVSRSGITCTVMRSQGGTTAAPHATTYMGSDGQPHPTPIYNDWQRGVRDLTLDPGFRIAHRDTLELFQSLGVWICIPSTLDQDWTQGTAWSDYHAIMQGPGMGDGSDGKADNRLCLARWGQAHSKPDTVNQDANTVSVRGQAMIDFLTPESDSMLTFAGASGYAIQDASRCLTPSKVFTWACQCRRSGPAVKNATLIGEGSSTSDTPIFQLRTDETTGTHADVALRDDEGFLVTLAGSASIDDLGWHHLAATCDGSTMTLYVDGVADGTADISSLGTITLDRLCYGALYRSKLVCGWTGDVDGVHGYPRALTAAEVAALARAAIG